MNLTAAGTTAGVALKSVQLRGAEKAASEAYRAYDEDDVEAPQRCRWRF